MKVYTLDGEVVKWSLNGYAIGYLPDQLCSGPHLKVRELLVQLFPTQLILEEVPIPKTSLKLDFFIPLRKIAVEIDGKQHLEHVPFFHKTKKDFHHAQSNDKNKESWCELNKIKMVRLRWDEEDKWKEQIHG